MRSLNAEGRLRLWVFSAIGAFLLGVLAATVVHELKASSELGTQYRPVTVTEAVLRG